MSVFFSPEELTALPKVFSAPRFATYLRATGADKQRALALYRWNMETSAALMVPLQICEIAIRNAAVEAIEAVHGADWPWSHGFRRSLPNPARGHSPQRELITVASAHTTPGKVVAELKFIFWQKMFTARHDQRIWAQQLRTVLPFLPVEQSISQLRQSLHDDLDKVRDLRNRVAHHEPIFGRALSAEYQRMRSVVRSRCETTATWVDRIQTVTRQIAFRPYEADVE
jgi:hypothetical protein